MSFAASAQQLKQRRDGESPLERGIKANIQRLQDSIRSAAEKVERESRGSHQLYVRENFDEFLFKSKQIQEETEQLFRDWTIDLASEPNERIRKKFTLEKLQQTFDIEVVNLRNVTKQVVDIQQKQQASAAAKQALGVANAREAQESSFEESDNLLLDDDEEQPSGLAALQSRFAQEREAGFQKIQGQVSEVNQMFRDIASLVKGQGHDMELIEDNAELTSQDTRAAVGELKKTSKRMRTNRERLLCILGVLLLCLLWVIVPHMHHLDANRQVELPGSSEPSAISELVQEVESKVEGPQLPDDSKRKGGHAEPTAEEEKEDGNANQ